MTKTVDVYDERSVEFHYDLRNHIWIYVRLTFLDEKGETYSFSDVNDNSKNFIFDTGAQNTIISKRRAIECGYLSLPVQNKVHAGGIGGGMLRCIRIEIPDMMITDELIIHRPSVLVPEDTSVNINILGQDILKPYSFYLDAKKQYIFFDLDNK